MLLSTLGSIVAGSLPRLVGIETSWGMHELRVSTSDLLGMPPNRESFVTEKEGSPSVGQATNTPRQPAQEAGDGDRSFAELARQLSDQTTALVRQEVELAKAELQAKGRKAGLGAGMFG